MLDTTLTTLVWCSIFNDSPLHFSFHLFISQVSFSLGNSAYHISLSLSMFTQFGLEPFPSSTECICPQTSKASESEFHTISVSRFVIHLANLPPLSKLVPKGKARPMGHSTRLKPSQTYPKQGCNCLPIRGNFQQHSLPNHKDPLNQIAAF